MNPDIRIFDDRYAHGFEEGTITNENFVSIVDKLCMADSIESNPYGFIKLQLPYIANEIRSKIDLENQIIRYIKIIPKVAYKDLLLNDMPKEFNIHGNKIPKNRKGIPNYMLKKYREYLNSDQTYPYADISMSNEEIVAMANLFYAEELNANYKNEYSIFEENIMENCSFNLEKVKNRLNDDCLRLVGLNTNYSFYGRRGSSSSIHPENYEIPSVNICIQGIKVWIVLNYQNSRLLDKEVQNTFANDAQFEFMDCEFKSSHKCIDITPTWLDERNIKYTYCVQRPGDLLVLNTGCSHMVVNVSPAIAVANNIFLPSNIDYESAKECVCNYGNYADCRIYIPNYETMREHERLLRVYPEIVKENEQLKNKLELLENSDCSTDCFDANICDIPIDTSLFKDPSDSDTTIIIEEEKKKVFRRKKKCPQCDYECRDKPKLREHIERKHIPKKERERKCICDLCSKKFFTNTEVRIHKSRKHKE